MAIETANAAGIAPEQIVEEVLAALRVPDVTRAFELADAALRKGIQHPALFNARAIWFEQQGRYREALVDFECTRAYLPRDPALLNSVGFCLLNLSRARDAVGAFDGAIAAAPDFARAHYGRGQALRTLGKFEEARHALQRSVAIDTDDMDALASLASIAARLGNFPEARSCAERVLKRDPRQPGANITLAMAELAQGDNAAAEHRLRAFIDDPQIGGDARTTVLGLYAEALDKQDRGPEAFAIHAALNQEIRARHAPQFNGVRAIDNALGLSAYFEKTEPWHTRPGPTPERDAPACHVFLLGFMRSGTTLLEAVLAGHPQTVALDERDCLRQAAQVFLGSGAGLDQLARLDNAERTHWRNVYWQSIGNQGLSVAGKVFVDKLPFNSLKLPLIAKLFPDAKILFAIRDPRDVVLSAFRQRFEINTDNFEFLRLDDCARYYATIMRLVTLYREKLPLDLHEHRYEDLVADFDTSVRAVCAFIGIDWNDSMRNFAAAPRSVDARSASAPQIRRGLYSGAGQWRRYRDELAPILPILEPWIARFGYPTE